MSSTTEPSPVGSEAEGMRVEMEREQERSKGCWVRMKCRSGCIVPRDANGARMSAELEREALSKATECVIRTLDTENDRKRG